MRTVDKFRIRGRNQQRGFTLLELLVVIAIIGILATLGVSSFWVYRSDAAYSVVEATMRNSRVSVEASTNDLDHPPPAVSFTQTNPGPVTDSNGRLYLPGFQIPKNVKFTAEYDPSCTVAGCQAEFIEIKHCLGHQYLQWIRFGDGNEQPFPVTGSGCQ